MTPQSGLVDVFTAEYAETAEDIVILLTLRSLR